MAEKPEIIKRLEKKIGKELKKLELGSTNGYASDERGNIIKLDVRNLNISDISFLEEFPHLTELDMSRNQINDISPLREFTALTRLDLKGNQITDVSPLQKLTALTFLDLGFNQINNVLPLQYLKNVKYLVLSSNHITKLPSEFMQLDLVIRWGYYYGAPGYGIFLAGNPLEIPPVEIVKQGNAAVRNYFTQLEKAQIRLLNAKLLIVGNGGVGKTTLMKKLKNNHFQVEVGKEQATHGINIVPWELNCTFAPGDVAPIKIHLWDFGGQDIYHATHQFFLTKRSLYLFVWEARKDEETRSFDYWLNIIKLLSAESPVIVVMNKADNLIKFIDEASFKDKFKNIVTFLQVSCVNGKGILELTETIRSSLQSMDHLRDKLPKVWMDIRNHLKNEKKDYITLKDYYEICRGYDLDKEQAIFLSDYLHDLGVILHYHHDQLLENTVILAPEWATQAVYSLIDTREIQENKGRFYFDDLGKYWDSGKFPRDKHVELVRLMEKFELCFPITGTDIHIVPELLPVQRTALDDGQYRQTGNLHFEYHYDFMPEGIISRFISRLYYLIKDDHFWKNGVELRFEGSLALVTAEPLNRKIKISITGSSKSELLAITRNDFEHIHRTLNMEKNKHYYEMIPCTCSRCIQSPAPHFYKHDVLRMFNRKGLPNYCQVSGEGVPINMLLKGIAPPEPRKDLLKTLLTAVHQLQGISKTIKPDEDSRSGFIALLLNIYGYYAKDQSRWGSSASGKSSGELDIKVENREREAESIIEAFNLNGVNRRVIDSHLKKLFGYDPAGLPKNFIIVYSEAEDFYGLWQKYLTNLPDIDLKYKLTRAPEEEETPWAGIQLARTLHAREGKVVTVYHLFVNMKI